MSSSKSQAQSIPAALERGQKPKKERLPQWTREDLVQRELEDPWNN